MSGKTSIEWATMVWNPTTGCTRVNEGCRNCYAFELHDKRHRAYKQGKLQMLPQYAKPFSEVQLFPERIDYPLHVKKPQRFFVDSMSDLFHSDIPFDFIEKVFDTMEKAHWHVFMVLTKRAWRAFEFFSWKWEKNILKDIEEGGLHGWQPPRNLWLGLSASRQKDFEEQITALKICKPHPVVLFLSLEPLLEPMDIEYELNEYDDTDEDGHGGFVPGIDWVIVGGESGKGARSTHPDWVRSILKQCKNYCTPFFFKQWGEYLPSENDEGEVYMLGEYGDPQYFNRVGKKKAGRLLDGREWNEFPNIYEEQKNNGKSKKAVDKGVSLDRGINK